MANFAEVITKYMEINGETRYKAECRLRDNNTVSIDYLYTIQEVERVAQRKAQAQQAAQQQAVPQVHPAAQPSSPTLTHAWKMDKKLNVESQSSTAEGTEPKPITNKPPLG